MPFFDKNSEIQVTVPENLPHWEQYGKLQFVTFRLADSLPQTKIMELREMRTRFEESHPLPWSEETVFKYHALIGPVENRLLDKGYGSCLLREERCRRYVAEAIRYFDGECYLIIAYVIMPNHVHTLLLTRPGFELIDIVGSIKRFSSTKINSMKGGKGSIWQRDYFDRMIRNERHFKYCVEYIMNNPKKLQEDEYELYLQLDYISGMQGLQ